MKKKQFAVYGMGSFGYSIATTLEKIGGEVLVVDRCKERIQEIADDVSYAICADVTEPEVLQSLGGKNLDVAIVALSDNLEAAIMAIMASKEMGIPYVLAKAKDDLQARILRKIGADAVILPEHEMGVRVAKNLTYGTFTDWIELSGEYSLVEAPIPECWIGKTLAELRVREKYDVNVVGLIQDSKVNVTLDPNQALPEKGLLILVGANKKLEIFSSLE